jgi:multidrug efflux system membrane fusion protein
MSTLSSRSYRWGAGAAAAAAMVGLVLALTAPSSDGQTQPSQSQASQSQASPATPVSVAVVEERNIAIWDEFSGRLEAVERVELRSRVAGAVLKAHFREGALVKQGDLLITIDPDPYAAEVERTKAQVLAAEARVALTRKEQERAEQLQKLGSSAISQSVFDQRVGAYREALGNLRAAQAALQSAQLNLDYTAVRAPVAGRVGKLEVTVGNLVTAGPEAPVLTRLVSVNPIYASFSADEEVVLRALKALAAGPNAHNGVERIPVEMATVTSNGAPYRGRLQLIDNQVDARSGTVRVRAVFENDDGALMPGQFARLRMGQGKNEPALMINERAIGTDQSKKFVMIVNAENKGEYREVTLGASVDGLRVVTNGLKPGERVVVNGLQRLRPGALVAPEMVGMEARSGAPTQSASGTPDVIQR